MTMKNILFYIFGVVIISITPIQAQSLTGAKIKSGKYKPAWESLEQYPGAPEWFLDAKFGIYTHWGPITKANEHRPDHAYGRDMYDPKTDEYEYHVKTYGDPKEVGYKDIIPLFQPNDFNAEEWARIFKESGARFAGPVAMHHDNFAMWDSKVTPWNIKRTFGRDITGELEKAIRAQGMKFVTSFHHAYTWRYYKSAYDDDAGVPGNESLYCIPHSDDVRQDAPEAAEFRKAWLGKLVEVIDNYQPDFIWFDWGIAAMPKEPVLDFFTHYFNSAEEWNKEVLVTFKKNPKKRYPGDFTVLDHERGGEMELSEEPWVNDTSIGPWFYNAKFGSKGNPLTDSLLELFIDLVSKNGCLLLNVPPDPQGNLTPATVRILKEFGTWLQLNGEAIYETRPWVVAEEGDGEIQGRVHIKSKMTSSDIRFTRSKDSSILYAITLDWPESGELLIKTLAKDKIDISHVEDIQLLGGKEKLNWEQTPEGLQITLGTQQPANNWAHSLKIRFKNKIPELNR
ncbi:alpha-L-fucosidase [Labilibacter sediminis]|nr:alpha-L-fucosidase [Labilibacter sediminis]